MALVLSIETSTSHCSVALHNQGHLVVSSGLHVVKSHAERLVLLIEDLLNHSHTTYHDLAAVAVSKGPGSYTGLRIGSSTAKGLCFGLDIPLLSIDSLEIMAQPYLGLGHPVCSMIDARRMEVFARACKQDGTLLFPSQPVIFSDKKPEFLDEYHESWILTGNGSTKCKGIWDAPLFVVDEPMAYASWMGRLAYEKFAKTDFENIAYFQPNYGKEYYFKTSTKKL